MLLAVFLLLPLALPDDLEARRKKRRHTQPPLKILSIALTPDRYVAGQGSLNLAIEVAIPNRTNDSALLEVSSLISSPSKRFMRFLTIRTPLLEGTDKNQMGEEYHSESALPGKGNPDRSPLTQSNKTPDRMLVNLLWDGTDQNKKVVPGGRYDYVIRAKLFALEDNGPRTHMVSWKKKRHLIVKPPTPQIGRAT